MADRSNEYAQTAVNDNDQRPEQKHKLFGISMQRDTAYYIVDILCLLLLIASFLFVSMYVDWEAYVWRFYVGFGCFMIFCIILAEVNHHNKFAFMTTYFHRYRYPLVVVFFVIALTDFILLELSDVGSDCDWNDADLVKNCPPLNPDEGGIRYWTRSLTILCGVLFIFCVMGYWERVSYFSAHNSWVIAILYMTVVGAIFLYFARCLEPPPPTEEERRYNWSWHQAQSKNNVFKIVVNIMIVVILFFVVMGSIVLAVFGDASRSSEALGTWSAMIIFAIIAHMIMITPLAPGSVVDVCAGFLFVSLFVNNENASIEASFFVSLLLTILLHFSGSCSQYYVGKIAAVQIWANKTLPPQMLAASDSVLKTANWFKVGVVGQVFMDTANGLNQGRMDMAFCTQFWSEYASIPNAIGLVSLGTILAIPSFGDDASKDYEWAEKAIPLVIMITSLWQMIASSWGAKELLASSDTVSYWTAHEKWSTVQHFYSMGYVPTHNGWKEDVYQLGTGRNGGSALFDEVHEYRVADLGRAESQFKTTFNPKEDMRKCGEFCRSLCTEPSNPTEQRELVRRQKELEDKSLELRKKHWIRIEEKLDEILENTDYLHRVTPEKRIRNFFADSVGAMFIVHLIMTLAIFGTGVGSYVLIARNIELSEAVKQGVSVLGSDTVSGTGWICFVLFWILIIIYFHREFYHDLKQTGQSIAFVCKGCKVEHGTEIETVFNPPYWHDGPQEYEEWVKKATAVFVKEAEV